MEPASRGPFLDDVCGVDTELRTEVESLLEHEGALGAFPESPDHSSVALLIDKNRAERLIGESIGRYEIVEVLGYGGMGVVYRAKQDRADRMVALKVVRGEHLVDDQHTKLFEREIRTLAKLKHPGIAAIHEAGSTDDGRHYFAMELVDGEALDEFIRVKRPSRTERLELMRRICNAINYAHQHGVIHRDIKPSNILIDQEAQPRVLDFGLAKITDSDMTMVSLATEVGRIQGTLSYMSPEQARGRSDDIDLRSDVYSLGVLLYEMFAERLPYDLKGFSLPEVVRIISEDTPVRLSSVDRALGGDVETMILKALEKDPDRRYQSAAALSADLGRYLNSQPIIARPPSALYQIRKFAVRHKLPFTLAAILCIAVSGAAIWGGVLSIRLARERDTALEAQRREADARAVAEENRESAEAVSDFLARLFENSDPAKAEGTEPSVRGLLDSGVARLESELSDQPLVQARLMTSLGAVYDRLGDFAKSKELLESALQIRVRKLGEDHLDVVESLVTLNQVLTRAGEFDRAFELVRRAYDICYAQYAEPHARIAEMLQMLGQNRFYSNDLQGAVDYFRRFVDMEKALHDSDHADVASALSDLGLALAQSGANDEAEATLLEALAMKRRLGDEDSVRLTLDNLAHAVASRGDFEGAARFLEEELQLARRIYHESHPKLAFVLHNYAFMVTRTRGPAEAEPIYREALDINRRAYGNEHPDIADNLADLGVLNIRMKDDRDAEALFVECLAIRRKLLDANHDFIAGTAMHLGEIYQRAGQFREAEPLLLESHAIFSANHGRDFNRTRRAVRDLANLYEEWNRPEHAADWKAKPPVKPKPSGS